MSVDEIDFEPTDAEVAWLDAHRAAKAGLEPREHSWLPRRMSVVANQPPPEPTLGGLGLVYPGKRHVFSGPPESVKTVAAYIVALCVVRAGGTALVIDFEMGAHDAKRRFVELGASEEELEAVLYLEPDTKATSADIESLVGLEPDLVVIDAAVGAFVLQGLDDNQRKDVEEWAQLWIEPFRRAEIATITVDHVTKNSEVRGAYAIGSERKLGGADVHLGFTTVRAISRGDHGLYRVVTHKDRPGFHKRGHLCDLKVTSDPITHAIEWEFVAAQVVDEEHPFRPTVLMEKVSRFLERQMEPVTTNTITGADLGKDDYVREALRILADEGFIAVADGPRRSRLYESRMAYREDSDEVETTASPLRPTASREPGEATASRVPTPFRGDADADAVSGTSPTASRSEEELPF